MIKNLKTFITIFVGVYFLFALKYMTQNLFQYFEYDYFNLSNEFLNFWHGLSHSKLLSRFALIDLTYIKGHIYNNNGAPVSLLYAILGDFAFGPILLVLVISLHLFSVKLLADENKYNGSRVVLFYFFFIPVVDLFFTKMFSSEIATWYALTFLSWGILYLRRNKYLLSSFLFLLTVLTRSEYIVICSLLAGVMIYSRKRAVVLYFVGIALMFYRNYIWTGEFPSFADGQGRLHDALISYYEFSLLDSPRYLMSRIWFHLKSLLFFDPSMNIFSFTSDGMFYLGTPLALVLFYWWLPLIGKREIKKVVRDYRLILVFCLIQFFAIAIASETFFVRYAYSYLFVLITICAFAVSKLSRKQYLLALLGQVVVLLIYNISFKPLVFENEKLTSKAIRTLLSEGALDSKPWSNKITNSLSCRDKTLTDRLVKGVELDNEHCFVDEHWVSITSAVVGSCTYRIVFKTEEDCSKIEYKNNFGQKGYLQPGIMSSCYYTNKFNNSVVISQFALPDKGAREITEISFNCM
ncbi:hypothetical protein [Bacteriovorax sp. Seq25_V]|uniref:hypothetical protein n=1 Tax=Bacteriovorax sp. Seq25_V TaxID=1201288 RepID=UPI00038A072A|nr:hypothetical protein [Bacteriovorax sp. Seq25_V]EQC46838.1 putative membrane protein [Bacteriovorax sp. Seq25_V]